MRAVSVLPGALALSTAVLVADDHSIIFDNAKKLVARYPRRTK